MQIIRIRAATTTIFRRSAWSPELTRAASSRLAAGCSFSRCLEGSPPKWGPDPSPPFFCEKDYSEFWNCRVEISSKVGAFVAESFRMCRLCRHFDLERGTLARRVRSRGSSGVERKMDRPSHGTPSRADGVSLSEEPGDQFKVGEICRTRQRGQSVHSVCERRPRRRWPGARRPSALALRDG